MEWNDKREQRLEFRAISDMDFENARLCRLKLEIDNGIDEMAKRYLAKELPDYAIEKGEIDVYYKFNFDKILEVMKRATPKKPLNVSGVNLNYGMCPECKEFLSRSNYCKHCGQRLDWR